MDILSAKAVQGDVIDRHSIPQGRGSRKKRKRPFRTAKEMKGLVKLIAASRKRRVYAGGNMQGQDGKVDIS